MADSFPRQHARTRRFTLGAPRSFTVAPDGQRVVFLRSTSGSDPVHRLWVLDVDTGTSTIVADPIELLGRDAETDLPPEELRRRERARESGGGIVSYATNREVTGAVYALGGKLYTTDLITGETAGLPSAAGVFDPRPDPTGQRVAYVADGDLHITSLEEGDRCLVGSDDPTLTHGLAEFVAAEEMGRSRGYWWSPDGEALLVAQVDTSDVDTWHIASPSDPAAPPVEIRYPGAGTTNATVSLAIHHLADKKPVDIAWDQGGTWEYLVQASWAPRHNPTMVVQSRDQRTVAVLTADPETGALHEDYRWSDDVWIDHVPGAPTWIGDQLLTVEDRGEARRLVLAGQPLTPDDLQVRRVVQADDEGVLVIASTDATAQQLVHVGLDATVTPLTTEQPLLDINVSLRRYGDRNLHTAVVLPAGADPDTPLPVLLDPYGGPHAQRVVRSHNAYGVSQWFADQGFAVVITDGRGTPGRGPAFERAVAGDLATPVLDDQIAALDAAAAEHPGFDLDRVAIRGWSFGGYLAALAVLAAPDRFHAAVAGAPVTEWRLYDTHYTERYLGHPDTDPDAYDRSSLIPLAGELTRPLLLIHGLADDNVVAAHTLQLSQALLEAGRPHQVLPLSGVTHMTPQEVVAENLLRLQLAFIRDALGIATTPDQKVQHSS